jgi:hypothetical protein
MSSGRGAILWLLIKAFARRLGIGPKSQLTITRPEYQYLPLIQFDD